MVEGSRFSARIQGTIHADLGLPADGVQGEAAPAADAAAPAQPDGLADLRWRAGAGSSSERPRSGIPIPMGVWPASSAACMRAPSAATRPRGGISHRTRTSCAPSNAPPTRSWARPRPWSWERCGDPYRSPDAYGWGKGRGAHQVIRVIRSELADSDSVVGTDIASCFEEIPHDLIFRQLTPIVSDDLFLALLRSYLHSVQSAPGRGVGRGTTLAPLLADIALANIPLNPADWPDFCPDPACTLHTCTQSPTPASPETIPWQGGPRGGAPRPVKG